MWDGENGAGGDHMFIERLMFDRVLLKHFQKMIHVLQN